jgi:hypothetical protein
MPYVSRICFLSALCGFSSYGPVSLRHWREAGAVIVTLDRDDAERLAVEFCGMAFNTPLVLLSGCVGFGEEYTRVEGFSNRDVGAVCLKGTTLEPRLGNAPHRVCETPAGMLNAIGLQNPGARHVVAEILPRLDFEETRFIANISGATLEEYAQVARIFDGSPIDALEINIPCPNVKEGGVAFGNDPDMSARVVAACREATDKPLITKLSPNQTGSMARRPPKSLEIQSPTEPFSDVSGGRPIAEDLISFPWRREC